MTHDDLIEIAAIWLRKKCGIVITEMATSGEEPDAIGWGTGGQSILIECKATRSDFMSDRKKLYRREPTLGIGCYRFYMAPKGLIDPEELPENWGLIEINNGKARVKKRARCS